MVTRAVRSRTRELGKRSVAHLFHTFGPPGAVPELIFEKGKGIILTDTDGKEYMDMSCYYHCASLGYGRRESMEAAAVYALQNMVPGPYNIPAIEYAEELAKFTPKNINHFLFVNIGSAAVESAIKLARAYWYFQGKPTKLKTICLTEAYHGATLYAMGLMTDPELRTPFGPDDPSIVRMPNYNCYRCPYSLIYPGCGIYCAHFLEEVIKAEGEDRIACFIAEAVIGYGGGITPPPEYFPIIREICTKRNILYIDDEVITGFCRTGRNFCVDHWNVEPDLMTMGKGMAGVYVPEAGVGVSDKVYSGLADNDIHHGFTTCMHPVCMAVAKAALRIYIEEGIAEHVAKLGNHVRERLEKEFMLLPNVGQVGGLGLMQAIELVADKETKRRFPPEADIRRVVLSKCYEKGLFPRMYTNFREDRMSVAPPLIITEEEMDKELDIAYSILKGLKDIKVK